MFIMGLFTKSMKNKLSFFILFLASFFLQCSEPARLNIPDDFSPQLVLNSWFCPGKNWELYLSKSYLPTDTTAQFIVDAEIELFEDGQSVGSFKHENKGRYSIAYQAQTQKVYRVEVNVDGFPQLIAEDSVPAIIPIDSAYFDSGREQGNVVFRDPENERNYYQIGPPHSSNPDPVVRAELYTTFNPYGDFFSDELIQGSSYTYTVSQNFNDLFVDPNHILQ